MLAAFVIRLTIFAQVSENLRFADFPGVQEAYAWSFRLGCVRGFPTMKDNDKYETNSLQQRTPR